MTGLAPDDLRAAAPARRQSTALQDLAVAVLQQLVNDAERQKLDEVEAQLSEESGHAVVPWSEGVGIWCRVLGLSPAAVVERVELQRAPRRAA